jgi:hypothetical protein
MLDERTFGKLLYSELAEIFLQPANHDGIEMRSSARSLDGDTAGEALGIEQLEKG